MVAAVDALATKGTFSVAIPSGSVVTALAACKDRLEFDNVHVFFTNDKVRAQTVQTPHVHESAHGTKRRLC